MRRRPSSRPLVLLGALALTATAQASGYRFGTQSAAAEGTANANAAEAADASTLFANPAGMTRLGGRWNVSAVLDIVKPELRFTDAGSQITLPGSGLQPRAISLPGEQVEPVDTALVPHAYASYRVSDELHLGLGVFVPWGAKLDYRPDWGGRYNMQSVELRSLAFNPNVAWKAGPLSLAGGLSLQFMEGKLKRAVPYASAYAAGLLRAAAQAQAGGAPSLALQLQQQAAQVFGDARYDGGIAVEGKDWGLGWNLALLWELGDRTRIGASYRSSVNFKLKGDADWTQPSTLPAEVLAVVLAAPFSDVTGARDHNDSKASVAVRAPESLSLHGFHQLTPRLALMADATWTRHSRLEELRIDFDSTSADSITPEHWKNSWKLALGLNWQLSDSVLLRAGLSKDRSPVPSHTRGPALPDSHRTWVAVGGQFRFSPGTTLDLSLGQVQLKDAAMDITDDAEGETPCNCSKARVRGNYQGKALIVGLQLNHQF